ncbi:hypothetical protein [Verminephrobacter aporrectodeae]|uniref:hypothetical protein n=1 Tax=Verminephrobacter aporrectodeae TaxID=1110389 RepID=UPI0022381B65|nr:hypothetical protein [Verminephrobacter aporrectodeae]
MLRSTRKALFEAAQALHDGGCIPTAFGLVQAGVQSGQRGLQATGLGLVNGAILLFASGRMAVQQHMALGVKHAL